MKNNAQTSQQNFHTHMKWAFLILSTYQIHNQSKIVQKSYPTKNSTNDQHCPNFTIPNTLTIQKCPKIRNDHTMISIQIIQYPKKKKNPQEQMTTKITMPTIKFPTKQEINKFTNKKQKMSSPCKKGGLEGNAMEMQREKNANGFQKWVFQGYSKAQRFEEIFKGMVEIELRSLKKWFSKKKMVWEKRKCKGNRVWNSNNGGRGRKKK